MIFAPGSGCWLRKLPRTDFSPMNAMTMIQLSAEGEKRFLDEQAIEQAIALGTRMLSPREFAQRVRGGTTKHDLQKVADGIRAGTIPARRVGGNWAIHLPTFLARGAGETGGVSRRGDRGRDGDRRGEGKRQKEKGKSGDGEQQRNGGGL